MTQGTQPLTRPFSGIAIPAVGTYQLDLPHTFITFSVHHMVVGRERGRFNSCRGTITVAEDPTQSSLEVSVDTASVDTQHDVRDEDLRGAHFLDVKTFPVMIYRATGVTPDLDGRWTLDGELTVRDITRPVPLFGTFQGAIIDPFGSTRVDLPRRRCRQQEGVWPDKGAQAGIRRASSRYGHRHRHQR